MAHEIDVSTGQAAVFVTGEPAWHRLGRVIEEAATSADAIRLAGLDWSVEQWPVYAHHTQFQGLPVACPNSVANVRTDTRAVLGVVSQGYRVFQNREAFDFMDALVDDGLARYETAGSLKGGRRVWMLARMPQEVRASSEDVVKPYVLLTNAHDGSMALRMIPTTVRVVCQNTLNLALNKAGARKGLTIRHCESLEGRVEEARQNLGILSRRVEQFAEEVERMAACKLSEREARGYFESLFPVKTQPPPVIPAAGLLDSILDNAGQRAELVSELLAANEEEQSRSVKRNQRILEAVFANFEHASNRDLDIQGTAWAAYNAVSGWADHQSIVRGKGELERADNRLNSIWFGSANDLKQEAYASALELALSA